MAYFVVHNFVVHFLDVLRVERRESSEHLIHERAKGPPVDSFAVGFSLKDFRGEILRCPTERHCPVVLCCEPLLGYLGVSKH
jgi:hypothetical protein